MLHSPKAKNQLLQVFDSGSYAIVKVLYSMGSTLAEKKPFE